MFFFFFLKYTTAECESGPEEIMRQYGGQNNVLSNSPHLVPGNCHYIILHGKRDFADVIQLRCGDYPLLGWDQSNHRAL